MRFNRSQIDTQAQLLVAKLFREKHVDIPMSSRSNVTKEVGGIVKAYLSDLAELESEARQVLIDNGIENEPGAFKRALHMLADKQDFPLEDSAITLINRNVQEYLWNSDEIEEIYSDEEQLVRIVRPFLLAMTY